MMMDYRINQLPPHVMIPKRTLEHKVAQQDKSFEKILKDTQQSLTISKHAEARLSERNIKITDMKWQQIAEQVSLAKGKGVTDSLVLTDEAALVVSAKNQTVITAMDRKEATERIFTNINGTILID